MCQGRLTLCPGRSIIFSMKFPRGGGARAKIFAWSFFVSGFARVSPFPSVGAFLFFAEIPFCSCLGAFFARLIFHGISFRPPPLIRGPICGLCPVYSRLTFAPFPCGRRWRLAHFAHISLSPRTLLYARGLRSVCVCFVSILFAHSTTSISRFKIWFCLVLILTRDLFSK